MRLLLAMAIGCCAVASAQIETFTIREEFGVSHPHQIIDFDLHSKPDPHNSYVIGPDGTEVPFQLLRDGRIAVETDLPARGEKTWRLYQGHAWRGSPGGVTVTTTATGYELTNGLTGIRIPRSAAELAPVQGVRYRNGTWTAAGPNYLLDAAEHRLGAKALAVEFPERGPLKVIAELSYTFARTSDYYRCTIEVEAGQPSVLIEEDTNLDLRYQFLVSPGLDPDQARYRGHHATSIASGHFANGKVYTQPTSEDGIRDLPFDAPAHLPLMAVWDPWIFDSGWYWQLYSASAPREANLFGIFAGRPSEALGAGFSGAGVYTTKDRTTGIRVTMTRRMPNGVVFDRIRFGWGIFAGTKADLGGAGETPGIGRQMNLHSGINLNKLHRYPVDADLKTAAKPLYMSRTAVEKMAFQTRQDPGYFRHLWDADPTARGLMDYWQQDPRKHDELVAEVRGLAHDLVQSLVNGNGIYDFRLHYWMAGLEMSRSANWISAILGSSAATAEDKRVARDAAVLFGEVLWDDDFVPLFEGHGVNLGTANMPVQQRGYRDLYALLLQELPEMRERARAVTEGARRDLRGTVSETGAHMGSTHYLGASMGPLMSTLQQLQTAGVWDAFREEPRITKFAGFLMNFLSPPEQRFGGIRKLVSIGDAGTESSELFGQLATAFAQSNPELSARLMWAWRRDGALHSGFYGTTILKIDESLPVKDPRLGDAAFPGWYTVQRNGWETRDETAVWFVNGDFYRDHAHEDNGQVLIYALGAPLSNDWGSLYDPPAPGALVHNAPVPETLVKSRWDGELQRENLGFRWQGATQEAFESFAHSSYSRASFHLRDGATWQRAVYSMHADPARPVIVIRDTFGGTGADAPKIVSFNVTAAGAVETPAGPVTPPPVDVERNLPTSSPGQTLGEGLSRFGFTGVTQAGRIAIDADIYTEGAMQASIGHWDFRGISSIEQGEFRRANDGKSFDEEQHILRLRGSHGFVTVMLPHRHNDPRPDSVTTRSGAIISKTGDETITFNEDSWNFRGPHGAGAGLFGSGSAGAGDYAVSGGPAEIFTEDGHTAVTMHGAAGRRTVRWPGGERTLEYGGGKPVTVDLTAN
jgi:hypothetical protein